MIRSFFLAFILLVVTSLPSAAANNEAVAAELTKMFEEGSADTGSAGVNAQFDLVRDYYATRSNKPVWVRDNGPKSKAKALLRELQTAAGHVLDPEDYNTDEIASLMTQTDPAELARLDMLLSGAIFEFGTHLRNGQIGPSEPTAFNGVRLVRLNPAEYIAGAADAGNFLTYAVGILGQDKRYVRLQGKISELSRIKDSGRWPIIDPNAPIEFGDLRDILLLAGDLPYHDREVESFKDETMLRAIRRYQDRHNIGVTGELDEATKAELAVSLSDRINQIRLNVERRRWQNLPLEDDHIYINLADRTARLVIDGETAGFAELVANENLAEIPTAYGTLKSVNKAGDKKELEIELELAGPDGDDTKTINLELNTPLEFKATMQVFITYITTWVSKDGRLHFAPDSYGRDEALGALIHGR
ncbi:MAG: hypothetical protein ACR2PH_07275 [Desulfobulbia bacterium]